MAILDHYRRMCETCQRHGLKPVVTYHHFTSPRWLVRQGGWNELETADKFARYCQKVTHHCGDLIEAVCTINEVNIPRLVALFWVSDDAANEGAGRFMSQAAQAFQVSAERPGVFNFARAEVAEAVILAAHHQARQAIKAERSL